MEDNDNVKLVLNKFVKMKEEARKKGLKDEVIKDAFVNDKSAKKSKRNVRTEKDSDAPKGLKSESIRVLFRQKSKKFNLLFCCSRSLFKVYFVLGLISSVLAYLYKEELLEYSEMKTSRCAIENNGFVQEISRPLVKCGMCEGLTHVPIEYNISSEVFREKYAYSGIPVLIKGATINWSAMDAFSFHFFKKLYTETEKALETIEEQCQFFPYKTEFDTLADAFNISDARANFTEGEMPWYIGWSNCHNEIQEVLREHYQRPYFLPEGSESSALDWIFMGGPGPGAFVHVLVIDTNQWYHATHIHQGEISITIGSEYD
ncbi:hypothetical protein MAR_028821 [Mya arenaria]|uniref:Cupin-like domain-containing protein n=1 Tax=Mya arenaria TaxID=6604 RepID=A0ABY7DGM6_MYAAR|nr:hypothetical protein MAR_028821 [Mya arenaria]